MEEAGTWRRQAHGGGRHMEEAGPWRRQAHGRGRHMEGAAVLWPPPRSSEDHFKGSSITQKAPVVAKYIASQIVCMDTGWASSNKFFKQLYNVPSQGRTLTYLLTSRGLRPHPS